MRSKSLAFSVTIALSSALARRSSSSSDGVANFGKVSCSHHLVPGSGEPLCREAGVMDVEQ